MVDCDASRLYAVGPRYTPSGGGSQVDATWARHRVRWCALAMALMVCSCSGVDKEKMAIAEMKWDLAPSAIQIHLATDPNLNLYDGRRHTVLLGICQTADPNSFLVQLSNQSTIGRLLETGQGLPTMIAGFNRFVISPGQKDTLALDRAQGAQYVGIDSRRLLQSRSSGGGALVRSPGRNAKEGFFLQNLYRAAAAAQYRPDAWPHRNCRSLAPCPRA